MEFKAYESPGKLTCFSLMRSSVFSLVVYLQGDFVFKNCKVLMRTVNPQLCVRRGENSLWGKKHI